MIMREKHLFKLTSLLIALLMGLAMVMMKMVVVKIAMVLLAKVM